MITISSKFSKVKLYIKDSISYILDNIDFFIINYKSSLSSVVLSIMNHPRYKIRYIRHLDVDKRDIPVLLN